ncbi:hypothetical protein [Microbacterium hydrothermale]|uniref:hypothetical protein n=1 Tax=Microbacterium hydrothermale TaxID=857427 RepID=UPI00142DC0B3|nr:hypothetical protein [Microbacterium hydrothermale]
MTAPTPTSASFGSVGESAGKNSVGTAATTAATPLSTAPRGRRYRGIASPLLPSDHLSLGE